MRLLLVASAASLCLACTQRPKTVPMRSPAGPGSPHLTFAAVADSFHAAAHDYDSLWISDGRQMTHELEVAAHLSFAEIGDTVIRVLVFEGVSSSGYHEKPMYLRASYPLATKKATLMHELGHRLESDLFRASENDHPFLFLWLYTAWANAYGEEFAREQVAVEKRRGGVYPAAWDSVLALSPTGRAARWDSVRASRHHDPPAESHSPAR
jgi:hypothetical protein